MSKLIGTNPNQVPSNADLGTAAFLDAKDFLTSRGSNLETINHVLQGNVDAVFVYDTTKDSDGGAWRKRTQHTSWYNEKLDVYDTVFGSRGSRREFPAIALIVLDSAGSGLCIYDADDPDLTLWMSFPYYAYSGTTWYGFGSALPDTTPTSISAVNGTIAFGNSHAANSSTGLTLIRFIQDDFFRHWLQSGSYNGNSLYKIADRGKRGVTWYDDENALYIDRMVYAVSMKVMPNAPIDPATKLPKPTIYMGNAVGCTIIKDDGTHVIGGETNSSWRVSRLLVDNNNTVWGHEGSGYSAWQLLSEYPYFTVNSIGVGSQGYQQTGQVSTAYGRNTTWPFAMPGRINSYYQNVAASGNSTNDVALATERGVGILRDYVEDRTKSMVAYLHTDFNTGWMVGDTQTAIADTSATDFTSTNLLKNGNFSSDTEWSKDGQIPSDWTISSGTANIADTNRTADNFLRQEVKELEDGEVYSFTITWNISAGDFDIRIGGNNRIFSIVANHGSSGTRTFTLRASSNNKLFEIVANQHAVGAFDNVSLYKAIENRCSAGLHNGTTGGNHYSFHGTIKRKPVVPGAELVGYSNFDANNYIRTEEWTLSYGAGSSVGICFMGWQKITTISQYQYMVSIRDSSSGQLMGLSVNSSSASNPGKPYLYDSSALHGASRIDDGAWHHMVAFRDGQRKALYVDGKLQAEILDTVTRTMTNVNQHNIGHYTSNGSDILYPHLGEIALVRIGRSCPTDEQIRQIYEDERHMFVENSKVSIIGKHGASGYVEQIKGVSYDTDMNHLHIANGKGRTTFHGLCNIDEESVSGGYSHVAGAKGIILEG